MLDDFGIDSIKFKNILRKLSKILRNFKKFIIRFPIFQEKLHTILCVIITDEDNNEMLMSKLESFDGHFKLTSTGQCENTHFICFIIHK